MKALIKYLAVALFGLAVVAQSASAGSYSLSSSTTPSSPSFMNGGDPHIPAGANVSWWAFSYGSASARVELGGVVTGIYHAPTNGSSGGGSTTSSAGTLQVRLYGQANYSVPGSGAGCGVTVNW